MGKLEGSTTATICYMLQITDTEGLRAYISDGSTADAFAGTTDVIDNTWHHVVLTWNGSLEVLYVDGEQDASNTQNRNAQVKDT